MKYISTRNNNTSIDFERVSLKGLASDGGLYLPKDWSSNENFKFECLDLSKDTIIEKLNEISPDYIVNLAAQAGVRHSLKFPHDYTRSNIDSFLNILGQLLSTSYIDFDKSSQKNLFF